MRRKLFAFIIPLALAAASAPFPAAAALETADCLGCHGDAGAVGRDLMVNPLTFDGTAHAELGCPACHEGVADTHPDDGIAPAKSECRGCHQEIHQEYARTAHAGNAACGDCHNPHQVHGSAEVSGQDMNRPCAACHSPADMTAAHDAWLPQADLHLEMLPCISCHTGSENYVINLFISRRARLAGMPTRGNPFELASQAELQELAGDGEIASLVDTDGSGEVSLAELRRFNGSSRFGDLRLKGMLTPETVTHGLQIQDNRWDCTYCHASGPDALQTSYLAIPQADGTYRRLPVEKGAVLDVLNGTPDFYMLGATRNRNLDLVGLAILAGGLVMPIGHGALRFLTRKNRR
jgi:hypothetical protein